MTARDPRPLQSAMPPHLAAIVDELGPRLGAVMTEALTRVVETGIAAGGDPSVVENDALSMQSQLVAMAASLFLASLAEAKGVPIAVAQQVGMPDVIARTGVLVDGIEALAALCAGATRQ